MAYTIAAPKPSPFQTINYVTTRVLGLLRLASIVESAQNLGWVLSRSRRALPALGDRFVPAANITAAEPFTKEDAERLKGEDYTLGQTFRAKVETRAGTLLSSATPAQVMDRRAKALDLDQAAPAKAAPKAKMG